MPGYLGDILAGSVIDDKFTTIQASGASTTLSGVPVLSVYKNSTTESTAGVTLTVDYDARTGLNFWSVDTSADGTFYAAGNNYEVVITTGTVNSISAVGYVVGSFSIENRTQKADLRKVLGNAPTATASGVLDVNAKNINNVSAASVTTINANLGTTQPQNFTGTGASALVKTDVIDIVSVAATLDANNALNVSAKYYAGTLIVASSIPVGTAAGAAGGLFISGTNAGTTTFGALTVTGATTLTGVVTASNAGNNIQVNVLKWASQTATVDSNNLPIVAPVTLGSQQPNFPLATPTNVDAAITANTLINTIETHAASADTNAATAATQATAAASSAATAATQSTTAATAAVVAAANVILVLAYSQRAVARGVVGSGSTTGSVVTASLEIAGSDVNQLSGRLLVFDKNTSTAALQCQNGGQIKTITLGATPVITLQGGNALTTAPQAGDTFTIY